MKITKKTYLEIFECLKKFRDENLKYSNFKNIDKYGEICTNWYLMNNDLVDILLNNDDNDK